MTLAAFLASKRLTQLAFARLVDVPAPMVSMWLSGKRRPGLANALKMERATKGAVPAAAWVSIERTSGEAKRKARRSAR